MRAIQIEEFGGPEVMHVADLPVPEPGDGEVLIRVETAGINWADTHARENEYIARYELPLVPGGEVVGVVERGAGDIRAGQRVVALTGTGAYAEYATAPADTTFPLPEGVEDSQALALLIQGLTAWHLYKTCGRVQRGESVVVISGAGGVGSLAVQLGKPLANAGRVIATASSEEKRGLTMRLGADAATDTDAEGLTERLIEANGGEKIDVVFEMSGGEVFEACRKALANLGRLVVYGIASRDQNTVRTGGLMRRSQSIVGFWLFEFLQRPELLREPLADLYMRAARGEVEAVVGGTYPLSEARRAHEDIQSRKTSGKLLLDVAGA
jgi:NADPH2:quinone reductase